MSAIFCIIDGMLDHAGDRLKACQLCSRQAAWGDFVTTPPGLPPDSLVCIGTLLGLCKAPAAYLLAHLFGNGGQRHTGR